MECLSLGTTTLKKYGGSAMIIFLSLGHRLYFLEKKFLEKFY